MTHGTILIKAADNHHSVELHNAHDGYIAEAIQTVLRLPFAMLDMMLATKSHKLAMLTGNGTKMRGDSDRIYREIVGLFDGLLPFDPHVVNVASMIVSSHFLGWFPMPQSNDTDFLDYWGHGNPDLVVTINGGRVPTMSFEIPEQEDEEEFEDLLDTVAAEVAELNEAVAPHTCYQVDGNTITYSFDRIMYALIANRYEELFAAVEGWSKKGAPAGIA